MKKICILYIILLIVGISAIAVMNSSVFWANLGELGAIVATIVSASCFLLSLLWAYLARKQGSLSHFAWAMAGGSLAGLAFVLPLLMY